MCVVDETWGSRSAHPLLHTWTEQRPLRLVQPVLAKGDPEPKALCCYGLSRTDREHIVLRFVEARPVRHVTTAFLTGLAQQMADEQKRDLVLIWDHAFGHVSREVRTWIRMHSQQVKRHGGVRLVTWRLPIKSLWLNLIEPHWVHGKRAIVSPARSLTAGAITSRVGDYFGSDFPHIPLIFGSFLSSGAETL